jgi:hypothetical protein
MGIDLARRRQPVALAGRSRMLGCAADRAAQRDLHVFRDGREIGLAIERRKNSAAHQGGATKAGQDRSAEPLDRDATAVDLAAGLAIDGKRRLVAELEPLGLDIPERGAPMTVFQD